jgi:hypothetical protein
VFERLVRERRAVERNEHAFRAIHDPGRTAVDT